jgi:hypothetical protein
MENKRRHAMDNDSSGNQTCWKLVCRDIGCAVLACAMWMATFYVVFGGNESHVLANNHSETPIIELQVLAALFH